jgi:tetratricopeptide (TPR) repeat protein
MARGSAGASFFMKYIYILLLSLCVLASPSGFAQEKEAWQQTAGKLLAMLNHSEQHERTWAARQLVALGEPVVPLLLEAYGQKNFTARREIVSVLGEIASPRARAQLLEALLDSDEGVRNRAVQSLLQLSERMPEILDSIKSIHNANPEIQKNIGMLWETILYRRVENLLMSLVSPQGGWGFFQGQFDPLVQLGEDAVPPLLDMFCEDKYIYVNVAYSRNIEIASKLRLLSGEALGDFSDHLGKHRKMAMERLRKLRQDKNQDIQDAALYALYRLGDRADLDQKIQTYQERIREYSRRSEEYKRRGLNDFAQSLQEELSRSCFELAMIYLRIHQDKEAIGLLRKAIENNRFFEIAYYNLACAYASIGEIDNGVEALEQAVANGYEDLGWIEKDGDLNPLRKHPKYQKIIADLTKKIRKN